MVSTCFTSMALELLHWLEISKIFFGKTSLLQNLTIGPCREGSGVHRHVGLSAVRMAQNLVTAGLSDLCKPSPKQFRQDFTR